MSSRQTTKIKVMVTLELPEGVKPGVAVGIIRAAVKGAQPMLDTAYADTVTASLISKEVTYGKR